MTKKETTKFVVQIRWSGILLFRNDTLKVSSPTLSQIYPFVATTPTRIWLISWNQPKIPVPLHQ